MIIFTGRFQPFHNGHLDMVRKLVEEYPDEKICVAIVLTTDITDENQDEFTQQVKAEWSRKHPIWDQETCIDIVSRVIKREFGEKVLVTTMPRASKSNWATIAKQFGDNRIWAFTQNRLKPDAWEETKCDFYRSMGDQVIRVPISKTINGTDIRSSIDNGDLESLKSYVPDEVYSYFSKMSIRSW